MIRQQPNTFLDIFDGDLFDDLNMFVTAFNMLNLKLTCKKLLHKESRCDPYLVCDLMKLKPTLCDVRHLAYYGYIDVIPRDASQAYIYFGLRKSNWISRDAVLMLDDVDILDLYWGACTSNNVAISSMIEGLQDEGEIELDLHLHGINGKLLNGDVEGAMRLFGCLDMLEPPQNNDEMQTYFDFIFDMIGYAYHIVVLGRLDLLEIIRPWIPDEFEPNLVLAIQCAESYAYRMPSDYYQDRVLTAIYLCYTGRLDVCDFKDVMRPNKMLLYACGLDMSDDVLACSRYVKRDKIIKYLIFELGANNLSQAFAVSCSNGMYYCAKLISSLRKFDADEAMSVTMFSGSTAWGIDMLRSRGAKSSTPVCFASCSHDDCRAPLRSLLTFEPKLVWPTMPSISEITSMLELAIKSPDYLEYQSDFIARMPTRECYLQMKEMFTRYGANEMLNILADDYDFHAYNAACYYFTLRWG